MADPKTHTKTPPYALYQREIFEKAAQTGEYPSFSVVPNDLEDAAKLKFTQNGYYYAASQAGLGHTHQANREAFYRYKIVSRQLVDTRYRDLSTTLFGHKIPAPICFAPVGINRIYHPSAELAPAKVAAELGLPYCLSTAASESIENVAKANRNGPRFFQLYMGHNDAITISLLERAFKNGFTACILTTDTWQLAWRPTDINIGNYAFYKGIGAEMGLSDPAFRSDYEKRFGKKPEDDLKDASTKWIDENVWHGQAHGWEKIPWVIEQWKRISNGLPFLIKGIQSVSDAEKAIEVGCDGIVVSNHAGRQVDGAIGSLDALAEISQAVGHKTTLLFDSGIRGGADIFKALALGAKSVLIGRLWIYGLAHEGEHGVRHVMKSLLADFDILMCVGGFRNLDEIRDGKALKFLQYASHTGARL